MEGKNAENTERRMKMALRTLMLRKKIDDKKKVLEELRGREADFQKRESELETAIGEAETEEDREGVEKLVEDFEREKKEHDEQKVNLEKEVGELEEELKREEEKQKETVVKSKESNERTGGRGMAAEHRTGFYGMSIQERDAFFGREDVQGFLRNVRTCIKEKRALNNVGLTIPNVMLELLKTKVEETSKLLGRITPRPVAGKARQRIMGTVPEAIWTEMCAALNEMDMGFNDIEVDGYKVGGFFSVCNTIIEDNDVNLTTEILNALGKSIGKALDKAIVYGTGVKMPLGIVTRLAQTAQPSDYPATAREWKNLSTSNILKGKGKSGIELFKELVTNSGVIENDYSESGLVWMMNKKTHTKLMVESMDKNLNAAVVAGINNQMPVIGGDIIELNFIPENNIVFGYLDMYLLAERAGTTLGQSEHVRFIEEQTVFKGTARYDGKPVIAEAFAACTITTDAVTTSVSFPTDKANEKAETGQGQSNE